METAEYTVARAFIDIDGITKQPGWKVRLPLWRAQVLHKAGFIAGPVYYPRPAVPWYTVHGSAQRATSREENVAGLESAILLANELRVRLNMHYADVAAHTTAADTDNVITSPQAGSIPTLITLVTEMLTSYAAHHADSRLVANWVYHATQGADHSLVSAVAPVNLQECVTRLNDLKAKHDLHVAGVVAHGAAGTAVTSADADYGAVVRVPIRGAKSTDLVTWGILDVGSGATVGVRATPGCGYLDLEFDADPQNDCIISYVVTRKL